MNVFIYIYILYVNYCILFHSFLRDRNIQISQCQMIVAAWVNVWKGSLIFPNTPTTTTTTSNNNKLRFRPWWVFGRLAWWSWTLWIPMSQRQWLLAPRWMTLIANTSRRRARNTRWLVAAGSDDSLFLELFERMWICDIWDFLPVRVTCEQNQRIYRDTEYSYRENLRQYNMASFWAWDFCLQVVMILFPKSAFEMLLERQSDDRSRTNWV